jgi:hypothetical protein
VPIVDVMRRRLILTGSTLRPRSVAFKSMVADEIARTVWPFVEGGRLKPVVDSTFPLAAAAEAHARIPRDHQRQWAHSGASGRRPLSSREQCRLCLSRPRLAADSDGPIRFGGHAALDVLGAV